MTALRTPGGADTPESVAEARERECPVLPCVPYTTVNADRLAQAPAPSPSGGAEGGARLGLALVVISTAQLMVVLDATIVNVALPSIQRSLHFSSSGLQWVISAYTLAFGGLLLFGGRLGDVLGRRRMFVGGLLVFSLGSLFGGLATSSAWLVAARAFQGTGAAIAAPTALALIGDTFPEGPARTRAMGVYAAMSGAGGALGLLLGGVLTDIASWRWVLFVNVPIGVLVAAAARRAIPRTVARGGHLDVPGAVAATGGMVALVYGLVRAPNAGWGDTVVDASLAGAAVLLAVFVAVEARSTHPLLPLRLLDDRNRAATYAVMLCSAGAIFGVFFFLTQVLQNAYGYSPLRAGVAFLPFSVGIAATSEVVAQLLSKAGPRVFATAGPLLSAVGLAWLSRLGPHTGYVEGILGPLVVLAVGLGLTFVPLTLGATSGVAPADLGIASALLNTAQQVGGTLGLAVLVTVATTLTRNALRSAAGHAARQSARAVAISSSIHGYRGAFLVGSAIAFTGFLVSATALRVAHPAAQRTPPRTLQATGEKTEDGPATGSRP